MRGDKSYIIPVIMGLLLLALAPVVLALDITSDLQISISATVESPGGTTPPPRGGGGGGGGGATLPPLPAQTSVTFAGRAFPLSRITILKDGQIAVTTIAGPDAKFYVALTGLASGNYLFSLYGQDNDGRRTSSFSFPIFVTSGVITNISDIFIAPTLDVDKSQVKRGDTITLFGQTIPDSSINIRLHSDQEIVLTAHSDPIGAYVYSYDTSPLEVGQHTAQAKTSVEAQVSPDSAAVGFAVGTKTVTKEADEKKERSDINGDGKINIVDFSVSAYWYKRPNPPKSIDLNDDGKVDLTDFSIMAYYWTG